MNDSIPSATSSHYHPHHVVPVKPFRILSLDGGGVRGVMSAVILESLLKENPRLLDEVDVIVGTSAGGLVSVGLGAGKSPTEVIKFFKDQSVNIFGPDNKQLFATGLLEAKYGSEGVRKALHNMLPNDPTMDQLQHKIMVTSMQLTDTKADHHHHKQHKDENHQHDHQHSPNWTPVVFHNIDDNPRQFRAHNELKAIDVAMATSAAPTYFPIAQIKIDDHVEGFTDGGVWANNPAVPGVGMAVKLGLCDVSNVLVISIGTGLFPEVIKPSHSWLSTYPNWGYMQWIINSPHPLESVLFQGAMEAADLAAVTMLGGRYLRLEPQLKTNIGLDAYYQIDELVKEGRDYYSAYKGSIAKWMGTFWDAKDINSIPRELLLKKISLERSVIVGIPRAEARLASASAAMMVIPSSDAASVVGVDRVVAVPPVSAAAAGDGALHQAAAMTHPGSHGRLKEASVGRRHYDVDEFVECACNSSGDGGGGGDDDGNGSNDRTAH